MRAVTRKPEGDAAKALAAAGAELVSADLDDVASLKKAFAGAYGAFCLTNYWEHMSPDKEIAQAKNLADASKASGVKHVVWSTLEDTRLRVPLSDDRMPTLHGRFKVPHFDTKGESDAAFDPAHTTWLRTSFYWDNLIYFGMGPKADESGQLGFVLPMDDKSYPASAPKISVNARSVSSNAAHPRSASTSASLAITSRAHKWQQHSRTRSNAASFTARFRQPFTARSASRARTISATCFSTRPSSRPNTAAPAA